MEKTAKIILLSILCLGFLVRSVGLTRNPPSLNWDEVSHGYNAYSILKTGMDQWGEKFPLINFRAYGDYPTTLNLYLTIPFIVLFGLSEFAIRFPHAVLGTLTILSTYFLALGLTKKQYISLLTAFLIAIGPWYMFTSRFVLQANLSIFLLITSVALFFNSKRSKYLLPLSLFVFSLTLFSYHTTRIFSPLLLVSAVLVYRKDIKSKLIYLFTVIFLFISFFILTIPGATARGNVLFILDKGAINKIEHARNNSTYPPLISKLLYNRPVYFAENFIKNYISYFSPRFLFLNGGTQYQFSIPNTGLIYPLGLPFFYLGLIVLFFRQKRNSNYKFIFWWLILSPVPASLTNESYTVIRATTMLPLPEILITSGLYFVIEKYFTKFYKIVIMVFITLCFMFLANYLKNYFGEYRVNYSWSWQYGHKEVVNYATTHYMEYDKILITKKYGEPHEFFLFYLKYDPLKYLADSEKVAYHKDGWYWVDHFDKFWFLNDWQIKTNPPEISALQQKFNTESGGPVDCVAQRCMLITSPGNVPPGWLKLETINFLDGSPAFEIYENR
jgi:4-amino-4-deoxy-L-arabinose transferase-like glycosyltransferase